MARLSIAKSNTSVSFNGTTSTASTAPIAGTLLDPGTNSFSITAWLYTPSGAAGRMAVGSKLDSASANKGFGIYVNGSGAISMIGSDGTNSFFPTPISCPYSQWYFVVGVVNRSANTSQCFVNMRPSNTNPVVTVGSLTPPAGYTFSIGCSGDASNTNKGVITIDNVTFYNRALTYSEIGNMYFNGEGSYPTNGLVSWWKNEEGSGNSMIDSINGYTMTLSNVSWTTNHP